MCHGALVDLKGTPGRLNEDLERDGLFRVRLVPGRVKEADRIRKRALTDISSMPPLIY